MSSLRGEGQGWIEALLQRGVEDEVRVASKFPTLSIFQYFQYFQYSQ